MAKLKARGREEIFRVSLERETPESDLTTRRKSFRSLTSDGNVLERETVVFRSDDRRHDYGWKVRGKARAGKNVEELLKIYLDRGWQLVSANPAYFDVRDDAIAAISTKPLRTEAGAARERTAREKRATKSAARRAHVESVQNGPGFYVTNNYIGGGKPRVADHEKPFSTYDEARDFAERRYARFREMGFDYLLPVLVAKAQNRREVEWSAGEMEIWWVDGRHKGPAPDPRQQGFAF